MANVYKELLMRLRNVKNASEIVNNHPLVIKDVNEGTFENDNPIIIEIGMGKGDFIIGLAKENPNINYIGIEKYESVIVRALEKIEEDIPNLRFICNDAKHLLDIFNIKIDAIWLTHSDPWPKKRHAKRRLTHKNFLNIYEKLFANEINIYMKTDNDGLFEYSMESLSENGYTFNAISVDLANSDIPNIQTEYERKFTTLGKNINYFHATKEP